MIKQADEKPETTEADQRGEDEDTKPGNTKPDPAFSKPSISTLERSGSQLIVRTVIGKAKSGTCKLSLKKDTKTVEKTAPVGLVTSYYTCQGFDVDIDEIGFGTWDVTVTLIINDESVSSDTETIIIE